VQLGPAHACADLFSAVIPQGGSNPLTPKLATDTTPVSSAAAAAENTACRPAGGVATGTPPVSSAAPDAVGGAPGTTLVSFPAACTPPVSTTATDTAGRSALAATKSFATSPTKKKFVKLDFVNTNSDKLAGNGKLPADVGVNPKDKLQVNPNTDSVTLAGNGKLPAAFGALSPGSVLNGRQGGSTPASAYGPPVLIPVGLSALEVGVDDCASDDSEATERMIAEEALALGVDREVCIYVYIYISI